MGDLTNNNPNNTTNNEKIAEQNPANETKEINNSKKDERTVVNEEVNNTIGDNNEQPIPQPNANNASNEKNVVPTATDQQGATTAETNGNNSQAKTDLENPLPLTDEELKYVEKVKNILTNNKKDSDVNISNDIRDEKLKKRILTEALKQIYNDKQQNNQEEKTIEKFIEDTANRKEILDFVFGNHSKEENPLIRLIDMEDNNKEKSIDNKKLVEFLLPKQKYSDALYHTLIAKNVKYTEILLKDKNETNSLAKIIYNGYNGIKSLEDIEKLEKIKETLRNEKFEKEEFKKDVEEWLKDISREEMILLSNKGIDIPILNKPNEDELQKIKNNRNKLYELAKENKGLTFDFKLPNVTYKKVTPLMAAIIETNDFTNDDVNFVTELAKIPGQLTKENSQRTLEIAKDLRKWDYYDIIDKVYQENILNKSNTTTITDIPTNQQGVSNSLNASGIQPQNEELKEINIELNSKNIDKIKEGIKKLAKTESYKDLYKQFLTKELLNEKGRTDVGERNIVALNELQSESKETNKIYKNIKKEFVLFSKEWSEFRKEIKDLDKFEELFIKFPEDLQKRKDIKNLNKFVEYTTQYPDFINMYGDTPSSHVFNQPNDALFTKFINDLGDKASECLEKPIYDDIFREDKQPTLLEQSFSKISNNNGENSLIGNIKDEFFRFKVIFSKSSEETQRDFLNNDAILTKFGSLPEEKQEKIINFIKMYSETKGTKIYEYSANRDQEQESLDVELGENVNSQSYCKPFYTLNEKGAAFKTKDGDNLLEQKEFTLQNSFLGLAYYKDKEAFALTPFGRSKHIQDENGKNVKGIKTSDVKNQQEAEIFANNSLKQAGGNIETLKKTMPVIQNAKITFKFKGEKISLEEAVDKATKILLKRREREFNENIKNGNILNLQQESKPITIDEISNILNLTVLGRTFSDMEMKQVKDTIAMQLVATKAFTQKFSEKYNNKINENTNQRGEQKATANMERLIEERQHIADGKSVTFGNGLSNKGLSDEQEKENLDLNPVTQGAVVKNATPNASEDIKLETTKSLNKTEIGSTKEDTIKANFSSFNKLGNVTGANSSSNPKQPSTIPTNINEKEAQKYVNF